MKKYLVAIVMIIVFVLGIINGITQKQSINTTKSNFWYDSQGNITDIGRKDGFVNIREVPIISKNHLIHLAKEELQEEKLKTRKYIKVEYLEDCNWYSVMFTTKGLESYYEDPDPDPMVAVADDYAIHVYLDKNGVTQFVAGG